MPNWLCCFYFHLHPSIARLCVTLTEPASSKARLTGLSPSSQHPEDSKHLTGSPVCGSWCGWAGGAMSGSLGASLSIRVPDHRNARPSQPFASPAFDLPGPRWLALRPRRRQLTHALALALALAWRLPSPEWPARRPQPPVSPAREGGLAYEGSLSRIRRPARGPAITSLAPPTVYHFGGLF